MSGDGERLQKVLAHAGVGSRRAVEDLITKGRVRVNGDRAVLGRRVDISNDVVEVDGRVVPLRTDLVYLLLNKPAGVVTTASDPHGRPTVLEVVARPERIWPVGRLDVDTEGALVLTNDGDLTQRLTHPSYGIHKTYLAEVAGGVGVGALRRLRRGVLLEDGPTSGARARVVGSVPGSSLVELEIAEGRNRQVRRMLEAVGHPVRRLVRTGVGPLMLGRLKSGTFRRLSAEEVRALYRATKP
jgi:23S rRNA pseudouridine2605 synthase